MANSIITPPITYGRGGTTTPLNQDAKLTQQSPQSSPSFGDLVMGRFEEALSVSKAAEQAPQKLHQGQISEAQFAMTINESLIQLAELKTMAEKGLSAIKETMQATT